MNRHKALEFVDFDDMSKASGLGYELFATLEELIAIHELGERSIGRGVVQTLGLRIRSIAKRLNLSAHWQNDGDLGMSVLEKMDGGEVAIARRIVELVRDSSDNDQVTPKETT